MDTNGPMITIPTNVFFKLETEDGIAEISDKCHQLRAAIQFLYEHAKKSFILGRELSFDGGGIANKSRYNPVCQYNSRKLDKYQIDFFVLVNASFGKNFIYHLDVYQGKNATNAFITAEAHSSPMTQKAVVNAIVLSSIANKLNGMREIYMDNRYSAPTLCLSSYVKNTKFRHVILSGVNAQDGTLKS